MKTGFSDNYSEEDGTIERHRKKKIFRLCYRQLLLWVYKRFVKFPCGIKKGHSGRSKRVMEVAPMKGEGTVIIELQPSFLILILIEYSN